MFKNRKWAGYICIVLETGSLLRERAHFPVRKKAEEVGKVRCLLGLGHEISNTLRVIGSICFLSHLSQTFLLNVLSLSSLVVVMVVMAVVGSFPRNWFLHLLICEHNSTVNYDEKELNFTPCTLISSNS